MSEKMKWLEKYAPLGINLSSEVFIYIVGMILATFRSLLFFVDYAMEYTNLYDNRGGERVLREGAIMKDFGSLTENLFTFAYIVCIVTLLVTIYHYMYHYQGSKMMYLMKRLPNKWEVHRRCFTLPIAGAVLMAMWVVVLKMLYFTFYILCTPSQCLPLPV